MSVKVISGLYRGRNLQTPEAVGDESPVRPTKSRVREAAFNMIFSRMDFADSLCLDLFAGSGAAGIEALSRGAEKAIFVDSDTSWVEKNIAGCKIPADQFKVVRGNALTFTTSEKADLIFADPPYGQNLMEETLKRKDFLGKAGTLWMLEVESKYTPELEGLGFELLKSKKYGKSTLYLLGQL